MLLICHLVFPAKYGSALFDEDADTVMKGLCIEIEDRYQMKFLEIGTGKDHVHFLVQSIPNLQRDQNSIDYTFREYGGQTRKREHINYGSLTGIEETITTQETYLSTQRPCERSCRPIGPALYGFDGARQMPRLCTPRSDRSRKACSCLP